jgi:hypothetical protein
MEISSVKRKAMAALVVLSFFSASAAFAVERKSQEQCVSEAEACYDTWYIPNWWCDSDYRDCRATWY